jgi:DMSO/TMAO reductase YedYZ heme-binding membrane subunit
MLVLIHLQLQNSSGKQTVINFWYTRRFVTILCIIFNFMRLWIYNWVYDDASANIYCQNMSADILNISSGILGMVLLFITLVEDELTV